MSIMRIPDTPNRGQRFWRLHVIALAKSGLSRSEYCWRHTLSYRAMTYWLRKSIPAAINTSSSITLVEVPPRLPVIVPSLRLHIGSSYTIEPSNYPIFVVSNMGLCEACSIMVLTPCSNVRTINKWK